MTSDRWLFLALAAAVLMAVLEGMQVVSPAEPDAAAVTPPR